MGDIYGSYLESLRFWLPLKPFADHSLWKEELPQISALVLVKIFMFLMGHRAKIMPESTNKNPTNLRGT